MLLASYVGESDRVSPGLALIDWQSIKERKQAGMHRCTNTVSFFCQPSCCVCYYTWRACLPAGHDVRSCAPAGYLTNYEYFLVSLDRGTINWQRQQHTRTTASIGSDPRKEIKLEQQQIYSRSTVLSVVYVRLARTTRKLHKPPIIRRGLLRKTLLFV